MKKKNYQKKERFVDVDELVERIGQETPTSGEYFYDYKLQQARKEEDILDEQDFHKKFKINFSDLPISQTCKRGLINRKFQKMTEIQRCVIPHALADRDIVAASKTGSGKTLCYLVPLIEKLYRHKFINVDGLGALVILPTRELAMQVFEVLNSFSSQIEISVGLVIGGKNVNYEKERIKQMNILICTPGRLLQHLQQTYGFETNNLQMLVLDEADIMLQMGFQETLKAILEYLPKTQTMLFSATFNSQIQLISNLSMNEPEKIFLHSIESAKDIENSINIYETPAKLSQYYMIMKPEQKINTLYSFLKTHQRQKIIVFVSTCKQVRFIYESFKKFRLRLPLYELQGHQKQKKRMAIYFTFCQKKYGVLICTNIASRGLDFPKIDWVIQYDIPEDQETYVHRIGRTARFKYQGKALTFVSQSEEQFVTDLKAKNIHIHKIKQNPQRFFKIVSSLQSICSEHQDVKYLAQRSIISYLKFVHKAHKKSWFNLKAIDSASLAESFGLQNAPIISVKTPKEEENQSQEQQQEKEKLTKIEKLRLKAKLKKNEIKQKKCEKLKNKKKQALQEQGDEGFLKIKQKHINDPNQKKILTVSKNRMKKIRNQGLFDGKNKIHFDDDLNQIEDEEYLKMQYLKNNEHNMRQERDFTQHIEANKEKDERYEKQRRKEKRRKIIEQKQIAKGDLLSKRSRKYEEDSADGDQIVQLGGSQDDDDQ